MLPNNILGLTHRERRIFIGSIILILIITLGVVVAAPGDVSLGGTTNTFSGNVVATGSVTGTTFNGTGFQFTNGTQIYGGPDPQTLPWGNISSTVQQPFGYLVGVFANSSYYAVNGTTGQYVNSWTSTVAETTFNSVLSSLTGNVQQKVSAIGWFNVGALIDVTSSYSTLDLTKAVLNNTATGSRIIIQSTDTTNVHILGGELDGNDITGDNSMGVYFRNVNSSTVEDTYIHHISYVDADAYGIKVLDSNYVDVIGGRVSECDSNGIWFENTKHSNMINWKGDNCANGATADKSAIYVIIGTNATARSQFCDIINCDGVTSGNHVAQLYQYIDFCYIRGGFFDGGVTDEIALGKSTNTNTCTNIGIIGAKINGTGGAVQINNFNVGSVISGNTIYAVGIGIDLPIGNSAVTGNTIYVYNSDKGIQISSAWNTVSVNQIYGTVGTEGLYGVRVSNNAAYIHNTIASNIIYGMQYGIVFEANSDYNFARGNSIYADDTPYTNNGGGNNTETDADNITY